MVKATLRNKSTKPAEPKTIDVEAKAVQNETKPVNAGEDLTDMLPGDCEDSPAPQQTTAVATRPKNTAVARHSTPSVEGFEGDWGAEDVKFPQLKLVQGSGKMSQDYDAGDIVFGEDLLTSATAKDETNPRLRFVPISITKQWREKLSQDQVAEGIMPRIVNTIAEVDELGGTTRWIGNEMPDNYWEPSSRCILLIEAPAGTEHPGFTMEYDGKSYAVAIYYAAGGAFRSSAKVIFNTAMTSLLVTVTDAEGKPVINPKTQRPVKKPMLYKNFWTLAFAKVQAGNFTPWRPIVKLQKEETGPDVRAYCESLTKNAEAAEVAASAE